MRLLIAPTAFKEGMTALQATEAIGQGAVRAAEGSGVRLTIDQCPLSDGGDGFLDACAAALGEATALRRVPVRGPLGEGVDATLALTRSEEAGTAVNAALIESAEAVGLRLVPADRRDPERATSAGLADLIRFALDDRCGRIVIGLGGSATCDGGVGVAAALGARFLDEAGQTIPGPTGADLARIRRINLSSVDPRLAGTTIIAACDVDNPLFGPNGAARIYAPQKGATPQQVDRLDSALANLARAARESGLTVDPAAPGAGAAGGLGFGLAAFLGAQLRPGAELVLELTRFRNRLRATSLVLTGEGRLDSQSLRGKACVEAARAAAESGVPAIALVGSLGDGWEECVAPRGPLAAAHAIAPTSMPVEEAMLRGPPLLQAAAERIVADWLARADAAPRTT